MARKKPIRHKVTRNGKTFFRGGGAGRSSFTQKSGSEYLKNLHSAANVYMTAKEQQRAKEIGQHIHRSGLIIYHDPERKDFYVHEGIVHNPKVHSEGENRRVYFKKNKPAHIKHLFTPIPHNSEQTF